MFKLSRFIKFVIFIIIVGFQERQLQQIFYFTGPPVYSGYLPNISIAYNPEDDTTHLTFLYCDVSDTSAAGQRDILRFPFVMLTVSAFSFIMIYRIDEYSNRLLQNGARQANQVT